MLPQIFCDLPDKRSARTRKHKKVPRTATVCRKDDQILGEKLWLVDNGRTCQVDRLTKIAPAFFGYENNLMWLFVRGDECAEKVCRDLSAPSANAGDGPRDRFSQDVLFAEDRSQARGERDWQRRWPFQVGGSIQLCQREPDPGFH